MNDGDCVMQPCEYVARWTLEHRGFTPTFAKSCKAHLSEAVEMMTDNAGGVVILSKWGFW